MYVVLERGPGVRYINREASDEAGTGVEQGETESADSALEMSAEGGEVKGGWLLLAGRTAVCQ